jgi:hypothetical protein
VINGHKIHLGTFGTAAEAARAWDRKAIEHRGSGTVTNFDAAEYEKEMAAFRAKTAAEAAERVDGKDGKGDDSARGDDDIEETGSCGYRGIYSRSGSGPSARPHVPHANNALLRFPAELRRRRVLFLSSFFKRDYFTPCCDGWHPWTILVC